MINSRSGRIHLFPAVLDDTTVAFRDMQARGGFEVSAECVSGRVTHVELCARRKTLCQLMNPWPGQTVVVRDETARRDVPHSVSDAQGECVAFNTRRGHTYRVRCVSP